jgi:peptidoglycan hydrolase-like protein with peptidoglycan-binding domain
MRLIRACSAAIVLVSLAAAPLLAQDDGRHPYGPAATSTAKHAPKAKPRTKAARKLEPAKDAAKKAAKNAAKDTTKPAAKSASKQADKRTAKPSTSGSAATAAPEKPSALPDAYMAIPLADRMALQSDLTWGGDFSGPIDGEFSDKLVEAMRAYQKRHKAPATGLLTAEQRAALAAAIAPRQKDVGWRLIEDPVTGARLGVPFKFATQVKPGQDGTRWSSEQGQFQIETFGIDTGATLEAVFDQQKKLPRRRISGSSLQDDTFSISGMQGLKKMVVRGYAQNGQIRVLTVLYDQAMEGTIDPLVAPITSAFVPFAKYSVASIADSPRRKVDYGTGVFVSAVGHVVTDRQLVAGCNSITVPGLGHAERIAVDGSGQIALLRAYAARNVQPIGLVENAAGDGVTLVGIADPQAQGGGDAITTASGQLGAGSGVRALDTTPALGFAGAAALDAQGRFAGIVVLKSGVVAGPAGGSPAAVVTADRVRNFLKANYVTLATGKPYVEAAKASIVRVICVRK